VDEFQSTLDDSHSHLFLTVVSATGSHDGSDNSFDNWALNLLELALLVTTSSVWNVNLLFNALNLEVSGKGNVGAFDTFVGPFSEEFGLNSELYLVLNLDLFNLISHEFIY